MWVFWGLGGEKPNMYHQSGDINRRMERYEKTKYRGYAAAQMAEQPKK
jgi:hypothetical protein